MVGPREKQQGASMCFPCCGSFWLHASKRAFNETKGSEGAVCTGVCVSQSCHVCACLNDSASKASSACEAIKDFNPSCTQRNHFR